MIEYLKQEEYPQLQLEASWALCNIASGTEIQCQSIADRGDIPLFSKLLLSKNVHLVEKVIWALGNLASECIKHRDDIIKAGGVANLVELLSNPPENKLEIEKIGCWALSNLCRGSPLPKYNDIEAAIQLLCHYIKSEKIIDK